MAKAAGKPLVLLPAVLVSRMQHSFLVHNAERGPLAPQDLAGRRVGVRSYSVTTGMWVRAILSGDFAVDTDRIRWITFEEPHVAEFRDPPNVERAPAGSDIEAMLLAGEIDAAILGKKPGDARIRPLIGDIAGAEAAWLKRTGAIQINHMVVARDALPRATLHEVYRLLAESRRAAGDPASNPFGVGPNRHNLEVAIDCVWRQQLIPQRYAIEELFGGHFS
jgi:4,5-dihydroxyphthalate decarboxylase